MRRLSGDEFRKLSAEKREFEDMGSVREILAGVRARGDAALREYTEKFDHAVLGDLAVGAADIKSAAAGVEPGLLDSLKAAAENIRAFAKAQREAFKNFEVEIRPGVFAGQAVFPLARAGVYVPGGRYALVSSLLMGAVPAAVAGVREIVVCTPPDRSGAVPPAILAAASLCGVKEVYRIGGAQAVAAMAYGTESIRRVDKIVGPGNDYVTEAKRSVAGDVGIDFIAGPTEVLIVADRTADPATIAADLIAQAEHDVRATAMLITDSGELAGKVEQEIGRLLTRVRTEATARRSLDERGMIVVVPDIETALELADERAPEHLELVVAGAEALARKLRNYGTLFVGGKAAEALGDYSSGLNHILPTQGAARYTGGLSVKDFLKIQTVLRVEDKGLAAIGPDAVRLARAEGLDGHALSIEVRLAK